MLTTVLMCLQGIPFQTSPARMQTVEELRKRGSEVVIFFPGIVKDKVLRSRVKRVINTQKMDAVSVRAKIKKINPDLVICSTIEDIRICFPLPYVMKHTDFYYYNLEIYVPSTQWKNRGFFHTISFGVDYWKNKLKEMIYVKGCQAIVIQDKLRKKIAKKYFISHKRTWLIPNSYYSDFRNEHTLQKTGIIYSGLLREDVLGSFIRQAKDFHDLQITLCGWSSYRELDLLDNPNIKVIRQNLSQEEYTGFISGYDIALVWYSTKEDDNIYNIGLSSGKFFKHLSIGQPVIVNRVPGLAEEVEKYALGVVVDDMSELAMAAQTIYAQYDRYVKRIQRIYEKKYDYGKASAQFFDTIIKRRHGRE